MSKHVTHVLFGKRFLAVAVLLGVGYLLGAASRATVVQADIRRGAAVQEPFQTGDQRCELVLREILGMLGKMDARIERMEKLATQFAIRNGQQLPGEAPSR